MYFVLIYKTDMFVPVKLFYSRIELKVQAVGRIVAALGKPDGWLVTLCMGGINCHIIFIVGVALGNGSVFVLGMIDAVIEEQIVTFA